jgi:tetratricopeptide (TPR) repeat protein
VQASPAETPGTTPEQAPPQQATPQAQPSAPEQQAPEDDKLDRELEAKQHFQLGSTFYDSGRFREAAEEFDEAYRLSGRPQLLYNLYVAYRDDGRLAESVEALSAYLKAVPDAPDRINLRARLESMQAQLAARRKREAEAQRAGEAPAVMAEPADDVPPARSVVPWVLMGAGSALVVASIGTGLAAKSGSDELAEACNDDRQCPASEQDAIDRTRRLAITTDALWAGGAAVAVTGLVLWLTGALDRERRPAAQMAVGADARSLRLSVAGRF